MAKIALVDDNKDQRDTNKIRLNLFLKQLKSDLGVIDIFPFSDRSEYYRFIDAEDIVAIIVDEKLYNDSQPNIPPVDYNGSDLVLDIRKRYKDIPFFTLTNYPEDQVLQEKINEYDYIFSKKEFTIKQVQIIQRACQRYLNENENELKEYSNLTKKIASGDREPADLEKLKALQEKLNIPFSTDLTDRKEWLEEFEKQLNLLIEIKAKLEKRLKR